jgi:cytochrome c556
MATVMEPAAEVYWDAVGVIVDEKGEHQLEPKTAEEWDAVRNAAYVVAESGNLLMMPSRAKDGGEWMAASQRMIEAAQKAIRAAESHDKDAVFDVGAEVYDACTNCHSKYSPEIVRPNAR